MYCNHRFDLLPVQCNHKSRSRPLQLALPTSMGTGAIPLDLTSLRIVKACGPDQYRTAYIHLSKTGEKKIERYDDEILTEEPRLLPTALATLERSYPGAVRRIAEEAGLQDEMFGDVAGINLPQSPASDATVPDLRPPLMWLCTKNLSAQP